MTSESRWLDQHRFSALQARKAQTTPEEDGCFEAAGWLRHHTITFGSGYGDQIKAMALTNLRNSYPEAYEAVVRKVVGRLTTEPKP